jgi:hypothetical protein
VSDDAETYEDSGYMQPQAPTDKPHTNLSRTVYFTRSTFGGFHAALMTSCFGE